MEFLRNFIKTGYLKAVGKMDDYKIILGATSYFDKDILKEQDLMEINESIQMQYMKNKEVLNDIAKNELSEISMEEE